MSSIEISELDLQHLQVIRKNVIAFVKTVSAKYGRPGTRLLDIAPQDHEGAAPFFSSDVVVETIDIEPDSGCTYIGDICSRNKSLPDEGFDYVVCTEVLEHTVHPFEAVKEIYRILRRGGYAFVSVPFNFRIHGPLPDCWRFTEHGLRLLFRDMEILELKGIDTPGRPLAPIHYTLVARKPRSG